MNSSKRRSELQKELHEARTRVSELEAELKRLEKEPLRKEHSLSDAQKMARVEEKLRASEERYRGITENAPIGEDMLRAVSRLADIFALAQEKNRAEKALQRRETMLQGFLNAIREPAFLISPEGVILFANATFAEEVRISPQDLTGSDIRSYLPPDMAESRFRHVREVVKTKKEKIFEDMLFDRHVEHLIYPVLDNGDVSSVAIIVLDVTERRQQEQELRVLRMAIESSSMNIVITDEKGDIEYANPAFCNVTGYSLEESIGQNPRILKSGEHDDDFYRDMWETISSGKTWHGEICNRKKNEALFWELASIAPVKDNDGVTTHYVAIKEDITEQRELLAKTLNEFQVLFQNTAVGIALVKYSTRLVYRVNERFTQIMGYCPDEVVGQSASMFFATEERFIDFRDEHLPKMLAGETIHAECQLQRKNGDIFWAEIFGKATASDSLEPVNIYSFHDISERKDLERLKEDVDRIMRHDLKTPLNGIIGLPRALLLDGCRFTDRERRLITLMEDAGRLMLRMIDQSLDLFKMEMGNYVYMPTDVDLAAIVKTVLNDCRSSSSAKNLNMIVKGLPDDSDLLVKADKDLLYTLFSNLVINAIEASPQGSDIVIDIFDGPRPTASITNRGVVPKEIRNCFFQKYKTHGKIKGTGLGTYSAKLIADVMGCELRMETSEEKDTTTLYLKFKGHAGRYVL